MANQRMKLVLLSSALVILQAAYSADAYCYAIASQTPLQSFHYVALMTSLGSCNPANVNVSRFYMSGACLNTRKNDFNSLPDCSKNGGSVSDATLATCERVFNSSAPKGTFQLISQVGVGNFFDQGDICNSGLQGFFFVSTNCTSFKQDARLQFTNQANNYCNTSWSPWHGLAYGVRVAISIVVICLVVLLCCLMFFLIRRRRMARYNQGPAVVGMQPYPQQQHPYPPQQQPHYGGPQQNYGGQPFSGQPYGGQQDPYSGQPYGGRPYGDQPYGGSSAYSSTQNGSYPPGKTEGAAPPGYPSRV